jgi:hypothetical protein
MEHTRRWATGTLLLFVALAWCAATVTWAQDTDGAPPPRPAQVLAGSTPAPPSVLSTAPPLELFFTAVGADARRADAALAEIAKAWQPGYAAMLVDLARLPWTSATPSTTDDGVPPPPALDEPSDGRGQASGRGPDVGPPLRQGSPVRQRLVRFLERQTRQRFGLDLEKWRAWMWALDYQPHPEYARFKGLVYRTIDPRMEGFFPPRAKALVRLDEIDWGGVTVNGIPPLVYPKTIPANEASYLRDDHIVFGVEVEGEARAYPKRILGWHEMARDRVGGVELTVVYCTLCGTVIPYESEVGGRRRTFGTSGLLYRSNKLMFDEETRSLWSTLEGRPVVGLLAGSGLQLRFRSAVTTTWGEWRKAHPTTRVLSTDTGFQRDYSEGAAYRDYFSHDRLMFGVSHVDARLKNKDDVLVMKFDGPQPGTTVPVAVATKLLARQPVFSTKAAGREVTIVTAAKGGSLVYEASGRRFVRRRDDGKVEDDRGGVWTPGEKFLVLDAEPSERLPRVPAHHAFWFGWVAQFPETVLVQ